MAIINLTTSNFQDEVINSNVPVLVDFWAEWCGPCKMVAPVIHDLADEMEGKLKVGKVNIDEEQNLASNFHIMSIPTLMLFKNGQVVQQVVGALSKDQLISKIKSFL